MSSTVNNGRFKPGNKAAVGNPHARRVAQLRAALMEGLTPVKWQGVIDALITAATAGDLAAIKLLVSYAIGQPLQAISPDRLDENDFEVMRLKPDPWQMDMLAGKHSGL